MKRFCLFTILVLLSLSLAHGQTAPRQGTSRATPPRQPKKERVEAPPVNILSIIPAQGEPGAVITVSGSGFGMEPAVYLGTNRVAMRTVDPSVLSFEIPELPAGLYALFVRRPDGSVSKVYNFSVSPRRPVIAAISPERIGACSGGSRDVTIRGAHFRPDSQVVFDGGIIAGEVQSSESMIFQMPQVPGGMHHVQVRNPTDDTASAARGITVETRPEITGVRRGAEGVTYYELIIEGRNFLQGSTVSVNGKRLSSAGWEGVERERVYYGGCDSIIYERHPYDTSPKTIRLQVINPTGEESAPFQLTTP